VTTSVNSKFQKNTLFACVSVWRLAVPLISFALLVSEILFVVRTLQVFRERGLIGESVVTKTGTGVLALVIFALFSGARVTSIALASTPLLLFVVLEHRQVQDFRARVPLFLDRWLLNLRLGLSVRSSRDAALRSESAALQALLRPLFETRGGARDGHLLLPPNMRRELEEISLADHSALARLENLRQVLRKTSEFRRKSGQAARQTSIQAFLMVFLLFALSLYNVQHYGWTRCADLICGAFLLSSVGIAAMLHFARRTKWKF
jgi:hypothetical protein